MVGGFCVLYFGVWKVGWLGFGIRILCFCFGVEGELFFVVGGCVCLVGVFLEGFV